MTIATKYQQNEVSDQERVRYYTVSQAAHKLHVHRTTITRWIRSGRLRASRVGPKAVRIAARDLEQVITPANDTGREVTDMEEVTDMKERQPDQYTILTGLPTQPLTDEEVSRGLAALARARAFREQLRAERGGGPAPDSTAIVREAREERSQRQ